ncbi:MAG: hypothetical protein MUF54_24345, partial [Polyangiaceae bacterium]|nr:hypothetical protein [Polyangiaceae bacterium]
GYDFARGEPRRKLIDRNDIQSGAGDCVDCLACVRTCPTGIDIRNGLQLECVGCTQCIDACDRIMGRVNRPRGLVRYTSLRQLEGKAPGLFRPRVLAYSAIMLAAVAILSTLIIRRASFEYDVVRRTGAPFYVQADGLVVNRVRLRITNRRDTAQQFNLEVVEPSGADLVTTQLPVQLASRAVVPVDALIRVPGSRFDDGRVEAVLRVAAAGGAALDTPFVLLGPLGGSP